MNFDCNEWYDDEDLGDDATMQQLMYPFSKHKPNLTVEELQRLDALADSVEIKRLAKMEVLTDSSSMPSDSKILSTRFVRTWREKLDSAGQPFWLRRSRLVAREFAWMDAERESLFSPASNAIVSRLLPEVS